MSIIPKLTNTQMAIAWGIAHYQEPEMEMFLESELELIEEKEKEFRDKGFWDIALKLSFEHQMYNEALQALTGNMKVSALDYTYKEVAKSWQRLIETGVFHGR